MTQRLNTLLEQLAGNVAPPDMAGRAWAIGRRRRRVRAAAITATPVLMVGIIAAVAVAVSSPRDVPDSGTNVAAATSASTSAVSAVASPAAAVTSAATRPSTAGDDKVQIAPKFVDEPSLPETASSLLKTIQLPKTPGEVRTLTQDPMESALALLQTSTSLWAPHEAFDIFALGTDGRLRYVKAELVETRDPGGYRALPLRSSALRADGRRAAFAQPEKVVIVDITTGKERSFAVPGLHVGVRWQPDGVRLIVTGGEDTKMLDTLTGEVTNYSLRFAPAFGTDADGVELLVARAVVDPGSVGNAKLARFDAATGRDTSVVELDPRVGFWNGYPAVRGGLVAQAATLRSTGLADASLLQDPAALVVLDRTSGAVIKMLAFPGDRMFGCPVLGWLDDQTVIFQSAGRILAWNVGTGAVTRLTEIDNYYVGWLNRPVTVSLAQL